MTVVDLLLIVGVGALVWFLLDKALDDHDPDGGTW